MANDGVQVKCGLILVNLGTLSAGESLPCTIWICSVSLDSMMYTLSQWGHYLAPVMAEPDHVRPDGVQLPSGLMLSGSTTQAQDRTWLAKVGDP